MQDNSNSSVSVVIPTLDRPMLVVRAVESVLNQTVLPIEIIVVIDGPDWTTKQTLENIDNPMLKICMLSERSGGSVTRNVGVHHAQGEWVAFLDDDDEWLPNKLEAQLEVALRSPYPYPIVTTQVTARTPNGDFCWPRKSPPTEINRIGDYLFARDGFFKGEGLIQTSSLMIPRDLLVKFPFTEALATHQDWDWLIRISHVAGTGVEFIREPLTIWYTEEKRASTSTRKSWHYSLEWVKENRSLISPRAYSGFIVSHVNSVACAARDYGAIWPMFREAVLYGQIRLIDLILFVGMWLIPRNVRHMLRRVSRQNSSGRDLSGQDY